MMPTVRGEVTLTESAEIEFELWCARCGSGICAETKYKKGSTNEFTTSCPDCEKDWERKEKELNEEIEELKSKVLDLEDELRNVQAV